MAVLGRGDEDTGAWCAAVLGRGAVDTGPWSVAVFGRGDEDKGAGYWLLFTASSPRY